MVSGESLSSQKEITEQGFLRYCIIRKSHRKQKCRIRSPEKMSTDPDPGSRGKTPDPGSGPPTHYFFFIKQMQFIRNYGENYLNLCLLLVPCTNSFSASFMGKSNGKFQFVWVLINKLDKCFF
jgi:hypothetical protein